MFHVMLVDDKEVFRRRIKRLPYWSACDSRFLISFEAENGLEAMDLLQKFPIDVVITDIRMPVLDGIELLKQIHNDNLCECVILLSEYADFEYAKQGIINGAFDYILKPIDNEKITDVMERAFSFLMSTQIPKPSAVSGISTLVQSMIREDKDKIMVYASRIWESICNVSQTEADALLLKEDALKSITNELEKKLPYLAEYIWLAEYTWLESETDEQTFLARIMDLALAIRPFLARGSNSVILQICERVLSDIGTAPRLQELADEYHLNVKYLGEQFKKETGQGYVQYVLKLKMTCAAFRMTHTEDRIYEIAYDLGYDDLDYFSKSFKKVMGLPPKTYRENKKNGR